MTKQQVADLVDDALGECKMHAAYSLSAVKYNATIFTLRAVRAGVYERLGIDAARAAQPEETSDAG